MYSGCWCSSLFEYDPSLVFFSSLFSSPTFYSPIHFHYLTTCLSCLLLCCLHAACCSERGRRDRLWNEWLWLGLSTYDSLVSAQLLVVPPSHLLIHPFLSHPASLMHFTLLNTSNTYKKKREKKGGKKEQRDRNQGWKAVFQSLQNQSKTRSQMVPAETRQTFLCRWSSLEPDGMSSVCFSSVNKTLVNIVMLTALVNGGRAESSAATVWPLSFIQWHCKVREGDTLYPPSLSLSKQK